jgi:hypothetical protein
MRSRANGADGRDDPDQGRSRCGDARGAGGGDHARPQRSPAARHGPPPGGDLRVDGRRAVRRPTIRAAPRATSRPPKPATSCCSRWNRKPARSRS